jgi:hypothetical protein
MTLTLRTISAREADKLSTFAETSVNTRADWDVLALQSPLGTLQVRPDIYDPLSARLLDDSEVMECFDL